MRDVERNRGNAWVGTSSLSRVVEKLAERVAELTVEVRRLKTHDAHAEDGRNSYGTVRGICACGWHTDYEERERVEKWIEAHHALYSGPNR